jgi:hypothetical protein
MESFIHLSGQVDGTAEDIHSYRAELMGILAAIEYTNTLCIQLGVSTGSCTIYCDNKGDLQASFGHKRPTPRWSSFDVVRRIRQELSTSPITWHHHHVKGHQDSSIPFQNSSYIASGNVLADHFATQPSSNRLYASNSSKTMNVEEQGVYFGPFASTAAARDRAMSHFNPAVSATRDRASSYSYPEGPDPNISLKELCIRQSYWREVISYKPQSRCIPMETYLVIAVTSSGPDDAPYVLKKFQRKRKW